MNILWAVESCFAPDYAQARERFRDAAGSAGLSVESWENPLKGPSGETLATDAVWVGPRTARRVFVMVSGTHGVEGFCGSGCQIDWLREEGPEGLPDGVAVLLIHAINPYGFAWLRRVTEEGCDLNRNCLDFDNPCPRTPDTTRWSIASCRHRWTTPPSRPRMSGSRPIRQSMESGRFRRHASPASTRPHSVFYGGDRPSWARQTLEAIVTHYDLASRDLVAVVDYHTGLGPFGYGEPICGHKPGTEGFRRVTTAYGQSVGVPETGASFSIPLTGTQRDHWTRCLGDKYMYVALEYGTYSTTRGLEVLRADHWLHAHGTVDWTSSKPKRSSRHSGRLSPGYGRLEGNGAAAEPYDPTSDAGSPGAGGLR